jgi:acyl-CoA synthetase (AMP-forming)/AMP-acid ligase II
MDNIFSFLQESAEKYPDKIFLTDRDKSLSYAEVYEETCALAERFAEFGLASGDRALIYLDNSVDYIEAFYAVLKKGGIVVPVNKNLTIDVIGYIAGEMSPAMIVTNAVFSKRLQGGAAAARILEIETVKSSGTAPNAGVDPKVDLSDLALILYTSGTTKMPKGVTLTHGNLTANTTSIVSYLGLKESDSLLGIVNFCYSYGNSLLLTHTKAGASIVIENRVSFPIKVIEQLYESRVTGFSSVGSYLNLLLKQSHLEPRHLKYLRYVTFAGESTDMDDIKKLKELAPHLDVFVMYGQTEASARLSYLEPDMLFVKSGSVGRGIPGVTLRVVTEDGAEAPPGIVGEMTARGENIMKGYWNNDEETQRVLKDGWLYTGDLAVADADGYYYIKGRKDDLIKFMGHRISPVEIEGVLNGCQGVLESAVVAVRRDGATQIKAFIVPGDGGLGGGDVDAYIKKTCPLSSGRSSLNLSTRCPGRRAARSCAASCAKKTVKRLTGEGYYVRHCRTHRRG